MNWETGIDINTNMCKVKSKSVHHLGVSDSVAPWTVARQAPLSMGLSRQGYWSGLPCPFPGDLPDPGPMYKVDN